VKDVGNICELKEIDCVVLKKCSKETRTKKSDNGKGYFYGVWGVYEGFDEELNLECQEQSLYDIWERYWDFYEMIIDYYTKFPDPKIKVYKEGKCDDEPKLVGIGNGITICHEEE
jgi:hypothetical protein